MANFFEICDCPSNSAQEGLQIEFDGVAEEERNGRFRVRDFDLERV